MGRIVCYGCVREVDILEDLDIGIQALAAIPVGADSKDVGETDLPVNFGGVTFLPDDHLYADTTGVILSPMHSTSSKQSRVKMGAKAPIFMPVAYRKHAKRGPVKTGPLTGSNVSNVVPSQEVHHVGTNEVFPGKQGNNNHSHLTWQLLFAKMQKLTTHGVVNLVRLAVWPFAGRPIRPRPPACG